MSDMITEELQSYLAMVLREEADDMLYEMARLGSGFHGIPNVVLWFGKSNKPNGLRIKVSNKQNEYDFDDNFVIRFPSLAFDSNQVASWITAETMSVILQYIAHNQQVLHNFEASDTMFSDHLIAMLSKV